MFFKLHYIVNSLLINDDNYLELNLTHPRVSKDSY